MVRSIDLIMGKTLQGLTWMKSIPFCLALQTPDPGSASFDLSVADLTHNLAPGMTDREMFRKFCTLVQAPNKPTAYVCSICNKAYKDQSNMKDHIFVVHLNISRHVCKMCGRRFSWRPDLATHKQGCAAQLHNT